MEENKMNVKELFENEELMNSIVEDIEDIPKDSIVSYEVWALGYTATEDCTDDGILIGEFANPDEAVKFADNITLETINELSDDKYDNDTAYFSVEVETVVEDPDDDDFGTVNIGSIYVRNIWIDGTEDTLADDYTNTVAVTSKDYKLLEDGYLEIDCSILKDFNKNDMVKIWFTDENKDYKTILTYKIISKTTANKFICEFIY